MLHFFNVTFPFSLPQVTALVTRLVGLNFELMQQVAVMKNNPVFTLPYVCPLTDSQPLFDQHLISPYNVTLESHNKVTRIKEMNTN